MIKLNIPVSRCFLIYVFLIFFVGCGLIRKQTGVEAGADDNGKYIGPAYGYFLTAEMEKYNGRMDRAILMLEKAIEIDPSTIFLRTELALLHIMQKDQKGALQVVEDILAIDPENIEALILKGRIFQDMERLDEAKNVYEKVIEVDPNQEDIYILLGKIYYDSGELDKTMHAYERLTERFPKSYIGHFFMGKILAEQGKLDAAEEEFKLTIRLSPELEEPQFELLKIYDQQGHEEKKIEIYEEILSRDPSNPEILLELAVYNKNNGNIKNAKEILMDLGRRSLTDRTIIPKVAQKFLEKEDYKAAVFILKGMLEGAPLSSDLNYLMGLATDGNGEKAVAIDFLRNVKPESRFYKDAVLHAAFLYQELGRTSEAIDFLKGIISIQAKPNADMLLYLGSFYETVENYEEAEKTLSKGLEIMPDNAQIHFRLGVLYDKRGDRNSAIREMKAVITLDPRNANALNYLGYTYADMGIELDEAESLVLRALEVQPDDGYIMDSLGWVYFKKGFFDRALERLEKAVAIVPDDPIILEHLGDVYLKVNAKEKALEFYRRSLSKKEKDKDKIEQKINELTGKGN